MKQLIAYFSRAGESEDALRQWLGAKPPLSLSGAAAGNTCLPAAITAVCITYHKSRLDMSVFFGV